MKINLKYSLNKFLLENILDFPNTILWLFIFFASGILFAYNNLLHLNLIIYVLSAVLIINTLFFPCKTYFIRQNITKSKVIFFENISDFIIVISAILSVFSFGYLRMSIRTRLNDTELINFYVDNIPVVGTLENIEFFSTKYRIVVKDIVSDTLPKNTNKIIFNVKFDEFEKSNLKIGDRFKFYASVYPIQNQMFISDFNYKKHLFYKNISGYGKITQIKNRIQLVKLSPFYIIQNKIGDIRYKISKYIINNLPSNVNGTVLAITTGDRNCISKRMQKNYRKAGISHLLAISGFHMGIIATLIFYIVRFLLTMIYPLSSKYDIKNFTYPIVLIFLTAYLFLSGAKISTERAYIMITAYILASMFGKTALPLRVLMFAGFIILMISPESIIDIGFILSFISVMTLITVFSSKSLQNYIKLCRYKSYLLSVFLTAFLSSIAISITTAIPLLYYFREYPIMSVLINIIVMPIFTIIIIPLSLIFLIVNPITSIFNKIFIELLSISIGTVNEIASSINKVIYINNISDFVMTTFIIGFVLFVLFKNKYIGVVIIFLSIFLLFFQNPDDNLDIVIINKNGDVLIKPNRQKQVMIFNIFKKNIGRYDYYKYNKIAKRFKINQKQIYPLIYNKYTRYITGDFLITFNSKNFNQEEIPCIKIKNQNLITEKCLNKKTVCEINFKKSNYKINYSND